VFFVDVSTKGDGAGEHFAAVGADGVRESLHLGAFLVLEGAVLRDVLQGTPLDATLEASVVPGLNVVSLHVHDQILLYCKLLRTVGALKLGLFVVRLHVVAQGARRKECFPTNFT